ncbi:MAG: NUDIX hydrolase [bacterium]|nr:NUDIX hydrolase [bacterium]
MVDESCEEILGAGRYIRLVRQRGWEYAERLNATGIAAILAVTDDRRLVLTEQYREPVRKTVIELPAGLVGDVQGEEHEPFAAAARRELHEETGYEAAEMAYLTEGPPSAGLSNEVITFYYARGLRKTGPGGGVGHERIQVHEVPLREVSTWLRDAAARGALIDPKVFTGLYFVTMP